jgi:hypothetical protein
MKNLSKIIVLMLLLKLMFISDINAQDLTQTIRGIVIDKDSKIPLPFTNISVISSNKNLGGITDINGNFKIANVPVGRHDIKVSFIGYEEKTITNLLVGSGKETVLTIEIIESVIELEDIVINGKKHKAEVLNDMATISARAFSVEETNRYAGAINDPARMVASFAGVTGDPQGNNDIVVRGNSPQGILWRLEGIEIPNPNHFSGEGATGGPINALNSTMLANSDFFTGAFSSEYGNATSGVFDMNLRKGNNEKREYSLGLSVVGTDITVEGPFSKNYNGSYLANYRYSTLGILSDIGIVDYGGIPKYQDASFKVFLPTKKLGVFSIFGLGGISSISEKVTDDEDENLIYQISETKANLGVMGLSNSYIFNPKMYLKSTLSIAGSSLQGIWRLLSQDGNFYTAEDGYLSKLSSKFTTVLNNKINARNKINFGIVFTNFTYNYTYDEYNLEQQTTYRLLNENGSSALLQAFAGWRHRFSEELSFTGGLHYTNFRLNNNYSIEPRFGLKWQFKPKQSITAGYGEHSRIEALSTYFAREFNDNSTDNYLNQNLELTKARHYVLGYDNMISKSIYFKTELYYQELYDVPVANDVNSTYSALNQSRGVPDIALINKGKGTNYGIEMTLEKYFTNNYYYLVTASLYNSEYKALNGISHETKWNGNYVFNALGGKEFSVGKPSKDKVMFISTKIAFVGGGKYMPIDLERSVGANKSVYQNNYADSDDMFKMDLTIGIRRNRKKTTHELKIEVQNVTNNSAMVQQYYSTAKQEIVESSQLPILPVISYKIDF